jgi:hypothetical protein
MIVAAYGLLLPQNVLDIPRFGCLNVHASLLPRWRGAAPIQAAILANDEFTGISLMRMTAGLDCGPVYCEHRIEIGANESAGELHDRLARLGSELLVNELGKIVAGELSPTEQDESLVTRYRSRMPSLTGRCRLTSCTGVSEPTTLPRVRSFLQAPAPKRCESRFGNPARTRQSARVPGHLCNMMPMASS